MRPSATPPDEKPTANPMTDLSGIDLSGIDLSVVIVSWNVWDLLRACLRSLEQVSRALDGSADRRAFGPPEANATLEVIVVDNASSDATVDLLPAVFPWVRLIRSTDNLGFTRANNVGYAASRGRFVYFLNPDTEIVHRHRPGAPSDWTTDSLWQLYQAIVANPQVGLVGPQLRYADNSLQSSRRRFPTPLTGFFESTWLGLLWPNNPWSRRLHMGDWPASFGHAVDWVVGAAMLARRDALESIRPPQAVGPWDEGFFMYHEEVDLCHRLKDAGWQIAYVAEAKVIHYEGRSSAKVPAARYLHFNRSKIRYYAKYFGPRWAEIMRRFLLWEFRVQWAIEGLKWLLGHRRDLRASRMRIYREVLATGLRDQ